MRRRCNRDTVLFRLFKPERYIVNYARVGIDGSVDEDGVMRYRQDYVPWSRPRLIDTREPGRSNAGHSAQFAQLSEEQKGALLEYLKKL